MRICKNEKISGAQMHFMCSINNGGKDMGLHDGLRPGLPGPGVSGRRLRRRPRPGRRRADRDADPGRRPRGRPPGDHLATMGQERLEDLLQVK